jgi:hypothetical protein
MKPISIKLTKISKVKETPEERKERLKYWGCTTTRIKQSKKIYNRKKVNKTIVISRIMWYNKFIICHSNINFLIKRRRGIINVGICYVGNCSILLVEGKEDNSAKSVFG